jgi:hypothetical protein
MGRVRGLEHQFLVFVAAGAAYELVYRHLAWVFPVVFPALAAKKRKSPW